MAEPITHAHLQASVDRAVAKALAKIDALFASSPATTSVVAAPPPSFPSAVMSKATATAAQPPAENKVAAVAATSAPAPAVAPVSPASPSSSAAATMAAATAVEPSAENRAAPPTATLAVAPAPTATTPMLPPSPPTTASGAINEILTNLDSISTSASATLASAAAIPTTVDSITAISPVASAIAVALTAAASQPLKFLPPTMAAPSLAAIKFSSLAATAATSTASPSAAAATSTAPIGPLLASYAALAPKSPGGHLLHRPSALQDSLRHARPRLWDPPRHTHPRPRQPAHKGRQHEDDNMVVKAGNNNWWPRRPTGSTPLPPCRAPPSPRLGRPPRNLSIITARGRAAFEGGEVLCLHRPVPPTPLAAATQPPPAATEFATMMVLWSFQPAICSPGEFVHWLQGNTSDACSNSKFVLRGLFLALLLASSRDGINVPLIKQSPTHVSVDMARDASAASCAITGNPACLGRNHFGWVPSTLPVSYVPFFTTSPAASFASTSALENVAASSIIADNIFLSATVSYDAMSPSGDIYITYSSSSAGSITTFPNGFATAWSQYFAMAFGSRPRHRHHHCTSSLSPPSLALPQLEDELPSRGVKCYGKWAGQRPRPTGTVA